MAELLDYKCPNCGSAIHFDSDTQQMRCPYCDSQFDVAALRRKDAVLDRQQPDDFSAMRHPEALSSDDMNGMCVFVCNSCGGEIVCDDNTVASACPFCGNPVVMSGRVSGMLKPDYVIPFKTDKETAIATLKSYTSKKLFAPRTFKTENRLKEIKSIYVPFWLFDSHVDVSVSYKGTKVRHWSDSRYNYTETKYYHILREGDMRFENIPVDGSRKMPDDLMESIEPFDFRDAVPFQTAYLAGYLADKYDVGIEQSKDRANKRMGSSAVSEFRNTVNGYNSVSLDSSSVRLLEGRAKYALYPVWLLNTEYKGEMLTFAMNGQTGKLIGNLPVSKLKLAGLFAGVTAVGFGIIALAFAHLGLL